MNASVRTPTVFDHEHYLRLIEARGQTIRESVSSLKRVIDISTALDAGCGLGFFAQILHETGLTVRAFDGREDNVQEGRRRFPNVRFEVGDVQNSDIRQLGEFDLVLCFGLLYHLESPLAAIRNLHALTRKALLLESICLPETRPWMLLREEPRLQDQSLTDLAFYASEGCLAKMLYRSGFSFVYRVDALPDHDDFKDTPDHVRRRTVLLATATEFATPGFTLIPEPRELADPWQREGGQVGTLRWRIDNFARKTMQQKYLAVAQRVRRVFSGLPIPMRLPFSAWWLVEHSALDYDLMTKGFESAEIKFVQRFLKPRMTVVDVGAHHGLYTLLASSLVGQSGKVIAFEPSPRERARLTRHLRLNRCKNVQVESAALGNQTAPAELYLVQGRQDYCNSLRPPSVAAETQSVRVQVTSLDEFLSGQSLGNIDLIKLDVEGAELDVLRGATKLLQSPSRPAMLVEIAEIRTAPWGYSPRETLSFLQSMEYIWYAIDHSGGLIELESSHDLRDTNLVALPKEQAAEVFAMLGAPSST